MTAVEFFYNKNISKPTPQYVKILKKDVKAEKRKNRFRADHLSKKDEKRVWHLLALSGHYLEGFIDCLDEMEALGILGKQHDLITARNKLLEGQKFFLNHAIEKGEEVFMARQEIQKAIEKLMNAILNMDIDDLSKFLNLAENIKYKN